jgi:hypothetical protein
LETPESDRFRELVRVGFEILKTMPGSELPHASRELRLLQAEFQKWEPKAEPASVPKLRLDESLATRFKRFDRSKQESLVESLAAFQVHSFALEGVIVSEDEVRQQMGAALLKEATPHASNAPNRD